jgi:hypothetical protein
LLFLAAGFFQTVHAQKNMSVHGTVTGEKGKSLAGASVYLSHTSKGVTTSVSGEFILQDLPEGKYDLVVSAIGYETKVIAISSETYPAQLAISLSRRATELAEVVVEASDKNGWRKFGSFFKENFIGTTRNARYCKIVNPEVIRFRFSGKNNRLIAKADEPIIIENKVLGYLISFRLIEFAADYNEGTVAFYGHPFFSELQIDTNKREVVLSNRRDAYYGSLMHFMRSVYDDDLGDENFTVRATLAKANVEKERVKSLLKDTADSSGPRYRITTVSFGTVHVAGDEGSLLSRDSLRYYKKVLKQRDTVTQKVVLESLAEMITKVGAYSKFLFFYNTMEVMYTGSSNRRTELSEIMLDTPKEIEILRNGSYFSPKELVTFKHWSRQEKICNMLPLDYSPDRPSTSTIGK